MENKEVRYQGRLKKIRTIGTATILGMGMIATYAFAAVGIGDEPNNPGGGPDPTIGEWFVDDNNHPATVESAKWFIQQMRNRTGKIAQGSDGKIQSALNDAVWDCQARGGTNCRLVAVGVAITSNKGWYSDKNFVGDAGLKAYKNSLNSFSFKQLSYNGYNYDINTPFDRGGGGQTTLRRLGEESIDRVGGKANINVIVLAQNEPAPPEVPPPAPSKVIEQGISADHMRNLTRISTETGVGGKALWMKDTFNPHGMRYTISDQSVWNTSTGQNISGCFDYNTANGTTPPNNEAFISWHCGTLPDKNTFEWRFNVTVDHPTISQVDNGGTVKWNDKPDQYTGWKTFPTWWGTPNKAWVFWNENENRWMSVSDRDWTNSVGADNMAIL